MRRLDRLNAHLHDAIHQATDRGFLSAYETQYIARDLEDIAVLATRLNAELVNQRRSARKCDYLALDHMREVLAIEILPALREMDTLLQPRRPPWTLAR
ncbi:MAG: hypothetical protein AAGJ83_07635 [Planctomycetota bacterium]